MKQEPSKRDDAYLAGITTIALLSESEVECIIRLDRLLLDPLVNRSQYQ
jgi:hypothetical protein